MREAGGPEGSELYSTEEEIVRLVEAFEAFALPQKQWTHQAHLTVGLWYVFHYPLEEATRRIRLGIQRYNESCGVRMTRDGGYHETITLFYIWAISKYLKEAGRKRSLVRLRERLLESSLGDRKFPLTYYSKERLMSWEARTRWIEPDLKPLEE